MTLYWTCLLIFGLLTLVFALPSVAGLSIVWTFGLAFFAILIVVHLFVVLFLFLPLALAPEGWKIAGFLASLALIGTYAFVPALIGKRQSAQLLAMVSELDIPSAAQPSDARSFELVFSNAAPANPRSRAVYALLVGGDADWVRIVYSNNKSYTFELDADAEEPTTVIVSPTDQQADIIVSVMPFEDDALSETVENSPFIDRLIVHDAQVRTHSETLYRRVALQIDSPTTPTLLHPDVENLMVNAARYVDHGYLISKARIGTSGITHLDALQAMGWGMEK
ncbi:hypothetical protein [Yoonia sp. BS5-3]|uniref:DUF1499 domain-containing protein n=1 Tax=Yoonia phaeophyticola TaxID=3137369 RepID=A0ABZ2VBB0_9RHOB